MMEGEEFTQQDANTQESSAPESSETASNETSTAPKAQEASEQAKPFHEDPRVQEYVERQISRRTQAFEQQLAEMQRRMAESPKPQTNTAHPFVQKLTEIDPKYGEWAANLEKSAQEVAEFRQWREEQQTQALIQKYESGIEKLHAENKVPKEYQEIYKAQIDAEAARNPKLGIKDLPDVYKSVHERISKALRATTAAYVKDKTQDSKVPTSPKGGKAPSTKGEKPKFGSKDEMYSSIVKQALKSSSAEGDI